MTSFNMQTLSLTALCAALFLLPSTVSGQEEGVSKATISKAIILPATIQPNFKVSGAGVSWRRRDKWKEPAVI